MIHFVSSLCGENAKQNASWEDYESGLKSGGGKVAILALLIHVEKVIDVAQAIGIGFWTPFELCERE